MTDHTDDVEHRSKHTQTPFLTNSPPEYFEGPEKKLEVYFSKSQRKLMEETCQDTWASILEPIGCTILHRLYTPRANAYLLSESSLFVFPDHVIFKTCGATTLLRLLPHVFHIAATIGRSILRVRYSHLRYNYPERQLYPHVSFDDEYAYLQRSFNATVKMSILGEEDSCWYMLSVEQTSDTLCSQSQDDSIEIAMKGMPGSVCDIYSGDAYEDLSGRKLAQRMTVSSGLAALLPGVQLDVWAFAPCGYSMNGLRDNYYYTVHVTPERNFSYASFETNDPDFHNPQLVERIIHMFAPSQAVMLLTTHHEECARPTYSIVGFNQTSEDTSVHLGNRVLLAAYSTSTHQIR